ncbi:adenosylcobinamide-GDP ribazoletransferase [Collibacillus ludicampi]|uniref:Adenosylcobinamide-GDP ribazoletransferase n=1 Tax=Collibacillus ludicampi TaxID=2771369 RepID=A0AAV4LHR5_9BACL|nr:adenosylcobinamide-GDP ribazoletransferase [Collibacillus ludicampi]GIM47390.1 adenosylcobinamide-GDP ribazoletransferase [Collibacillus ludicampi]
MKPFLLAVQFLTRIPVRITIVNERDLVRSVAFYPYVGLMLGIIYACLSFLMFTWFQGHIAALFMVIVSIILTGGLHLDGLMDTADGLLSGRSRERMLEIMKDSRIGAMGAIALLIVFSLKWAFFEQLGANTHWIWILMPAFGRYAMVLLIAWFPYAREEGMGKVFAGKVGTFHIIGGGLFLILPIYVWKGLGAAMIPLFFVTVYGIGRLWVKKLGGLTGDTYGAMCEIQELVVLIAMEVIRRWM